MLLVPYMRSLGVLGFGRAGGENRHSLDVIAQFEFGQRYSLLLKSGATVDFQDFETTISCLHDELRLGDTWDAEYGLSRVGKPKLVVVPENTMGRPWGRNLKRLVADISMWVAEYNLTEQWSKDIPPLTTLTPWSSRWT